MRTKSGEAEYGRNFGVPEKKCINFGAGHCFISSSMPSMYMGLMNSIALVPRDISHVLHYHAHVDLLEKIFK